MILSRKNALKSVEGVKKSLILAEMWAKNGRNLALKVGDFGQIWRRNGDFSSSRVGNTDFKI